MCFVLNVSNTTEILPGTHVPKENNASFSADSFSVDVFNSKLLTGQLIGFFYLVF